MENIKNTAFIIAEYNPFHNGHKYHIEKTRAAGAENIICIMNGSFMQRGEPAFYSKTDRAKTAVENGADLVLELPLKYGISSANYFALGGVMTAHLTGLDGTLSFGAAAGQAELSAYARLLSDGSISERLRAISDNTGKSYPAAFGEYLTGYAPELLPVLNDANSVLAAEYIAAIEKYAPELDYYAVERHKGARHDARCPDGRFASAKYLRDEITAGNINGVGFYMPESAFKVLCKAFEEGKCTGDRRHFSDISISRLADCKADYFTDINGVSQGLENRIVEAILTSSDLVSLYNTVKTKRFTHSRVRQIILSAVLGVKRCDLEAGVSYIRVLGFNNKGRTLLRELRDTAKAPVVTNISDINERSSIQAQRDKYLDITSGKLFELCKNSPESINAELLIKPYISD